MVYNDDDDDDVHVNDTGILGKKSHSLVIRLLAVGCSTTELQETRGNLKAVKLGS